MPSLVYVLAVYPARIHVIQLLPGIEVRVAVNAVRPGGHSGHAVLALYPRRP